MNDAIGPELSSKLAEELAPDEKVLINTRPSFASTVNPYGALLFTIAMIAIPVVWILGASQTKNSSIGFILFGIFWGILWISAWVSQNDIIPLLTGKTIYAVTNKRLLILRVGKNSKKAESFAPSALGSISKIEKRNGSGDLIIAQLLERGKGSYYVKNLKLHGLSPVADWEKHLLQLAGRTIVS
jgi:hypothetical protein